MNAETLNQYLYLWKHPSNFAETPYNWWICIFHANQFLTFVSLSCTRKKQIIMAYYLCKAAWTNTSHTHSHAHMLYVRSPLMRVPSSMIIFLKLLQFPHCDQPAFKLRCPLTCRLWENMFFKSTHQTLVQRNELMDALTSHHISFDRSKQLRDRKTNCFIGLYADAS